MADREMHSGLCCDIVGQARVASACGECYRKALSWREVLCGVTCRTRCLMMQHHMTQDMVPNNGG